MEYESCAIKGFVAQSCAHNDTTVYVHSMVTVTERKGGELTGQGDCRKTETFSSSNISCRKSLRMKPEMLPEIGTLPRWGADWKSSQRTCNHQHHKKDVTKNNLSPIRSQLKVKGQIVTFFCPLQNPVVDHHTDLRHEPLVVWVTGDALEEEGHGGVLQGRPVLSGQSSRGT